MKEILVTGMFLLAVGGLSPARGEDSLLYETWLTSALEPQRLDDFVQAHGAQYSEDYFQCSQEAQRLIRDEANIRNRRCEFSGDSVLRDRCRQDNHFRRVDKHLAELDQTIRQHKAWLDLESGRKAAAAAKAAEEFDKSCAPAACDVEKRKRTQLLRDLKPYLQCPPVAERPSEIDPTFKDFKLPSDPGG